MEFDWAEEDLSYRSELQAFLAEELPGRWEGATAVLGSADNAEYSRRFAGLLAEKGWLTPHWPTEWGGTGATPWMLAVLGEELWSRGEPRGPQYMNVNWIGPSIMAHGTVEQCQRYLPPIAAGDVIWCQGFSEPEAGTDLASLQTRAVRDGDDWVINGTKMFISGAASADFLLVQAVTDPDKRQRGGITMFIIDNPTPGVSFEPIRVWVVPTKAQQHYIHLDNVRVPQTQVLGEVGEGFNLGQQWLVHHDRLLRGAMALGILTRALQMAIDWSQERVTYGRPIADRQAIQWMLTDVYMDIVALRSVARETAARADAGEDVRVEASMVKYAAGEWGWRSIDKIMQIFGGVGETLDMPIPHWYHMLRHARIGGGTSEIHKFVMARALLGGRVNFQG